MYKIVQNRKLYIVSAGKKNFINNVFTVFGNMRPDILVLMETKIPSSRAGNIMSALGYNYWELVEGEGFSGGIWMAWNNHNADI